MIFVRRGAGLRHIVTSVRPTHTVCGLEVDNTKKRDRFDTGHPWRQVGKKDGSKLCSSCDRMKDADTVREPTRSRKRVVRSGVCRVCGCTDLEGCDGGCGWVDAEHTLCSACTDGRIPSREGPPSAVLVCYCPHCRTVQGICTPEEKRLSRLAVGTCDTCRPPARGRRWRVWLTYELAGAARHRKTLDSALGSKGERRRRRRSEAA